MHIPRTPFLDRDAAALVEVRESHFDPAAQVFLTLDRKKPFLLARPGRQSRRVWSLLIPSPRTVPDP